jgi:hypothetical protein
VVVREEPDELLHRLLAPDEGGELDGEVVAHGEREQGREVDLETGVAELPHLLGSLQVFEPVGAEVPQAGVGRQVLADDGRGPAREERLPPMGDVPQARRSVDLQPLVVGLPDGGFSGVEAHPNPKGDASGPLLGADRQLEGQCCRHRVLRPGEGGQHRVALAPVRDDAPVFGHDGAHNLVMAGQRPSGQLRMLTPQARRPLDIGQQERDLAGGQSRHPPPPER